jgi:UDP-N-acetylmuramate-alanine ligase
MEGWLIMVVAGVIGSKNNSIILKNISSLLSDKSVKVSIIELHNFLEGSSEVLHSYLRELSKNNIEIAIIYINEESIKFIGEISIDFNVMLFYMDNNNLKFLEANKENFIHAINRIKKDGFLIINSDILLFQDILEGRALHFVTYGFNSKANITASSVGDGLSEEFFLCSLQRPNINIKKEVAEPQEFKLKRFYANASDYEMLAVIAFGIVLGIEI